MVFKYITVEGEATAIDTKTQLTTQGSKGTITPIQVPAGVTTLQGIWAAGTHDQAATGNSSAFLRLEGAAFPQGPETVSLSSAGGSVATGVNHVMNSRFIPLGVSVVSGNEAEVFLEFVNEDTGTWHAVCTMVFS